MSNLINLVMIGSTAAFYAMMQMVLNRLVMAVIIALSIVTGYNTLWVWGVCVILLPILLVGLIAAIAQVYILTRNLLAPETRNERIAGWIAGRLGL